jgi:hypothetical protein
VEQVNPEEAAGGEVTVAGDRASPDSPSFRISMLNILISAALVILATYTQRLRAEIPVFDLEDPL